MSPWTITFIDGVLTGLGLYLLVRLRIYLGPVAGRKWGAWGRWSVWLLLIAGMVVLAELNLLWLRRRLEEIHADGVHWHYEAVYAATILAVGLGLVWVQALRNRKAAAAKPALKAENEMPRRPE